MRESHKFTTLRHVIQIYVCVAKVVHFINLYCLYVLQFLIYVNVNIHFRFCEKC